MPDTGHIATGLLDVRDLCVRFRTRRGEINAVDHLSFTVNSGETLGVVGESGSGKSVSMLSLMRLIRSPNCTVEGQAFFRGEDILAMTDKQLRRLRGADIAMIFQDPMTALTPVYTVGWHIAEQLRAHGSISRRAARVRAVELLEEVGIPKPQQRIDDYPHQFSGGMRQRAVIAMALANSPALLIADEPTTALDVTTQAQILDLLARLRREHGSAIIMITHDMGVVSQISDRVMVMYAGRAVEIGARADVFRHSCHPYTGGLLRSVPRVSAHRPHRLTTIAGQPVSLDALPTGCAFQPRCVNISDSCVQRPELTDTGDHQVACWNPLENPDAPAQDQSHTADPVRQNIS